MSFLAINPFDAGLTTLDTGMKVIGTQTIQAIRVKILKHGIIADGTLTLEVLEGARSLGSVGITYSEFNSVGGTYAWGFFAFNFSDAISINTAEDTTETELTLRFTMSGHTPDDDNYIALVRQFESEFVEEFGIRPTPVSPEQDGWNNPWGIELYIADRG